MTIPRTVRQFAAGDMAGCAGVPDRMYDAVLAAFDVSFGRSA